MFFGFAPFRKINVRLNYMFQVQSEFWKRFWSND